MPDVPRPISIEDEVLENIRRQAAGLGTVEDLNLPLAFLRRVADRVIRRSFEERYRAVVAPAGEGTKRDDDSHAAPDADRAASVSGAPGGSRHRTADESAAGLDRADAMPVLHRGGTVTIVPLDPTEAERCRHLPEAVPPLRGFRLPVASAEGLPWPFTLPPGASTSPLGLAARLTARRLACDGLLMTAALAAEALMRSGPAESAPARAPAYAPHQIPEALCQVGLPIDLLTGAFEGPVLERIIAAIAAGRPASSLRRELARVPFAFRPSCPGFTLTPLAGDSAIAALRVQATRPDYWGGIGAGSSLDVIRQLAQALPEARIIVAAEQGHVAPLARELASWKQPQRLQIVACPLRVSQWARDHACVGTVAGRIAFLLPRYPSRAEEYSFMVPGDGYAAAAAARAAGVDVIASPLLFQGGNVLPLREPRSGRRFVLVGEAEVYRNVALGLTPAQAEEALRLEFGADRCLILPAVSFHVDFEVSVRNTAGGWVACVPDTRAGARMVVRAGLDALARASLLTAASHARAMDALAGQRWREVLELAWGAVLPHAGPAGGFPLPLADLFSTGPGDSGVGNFQRFLLALDVITALERPVMPSISDPHARAYLESLRRTEQDRQRLHRRLQDLGMRLVPVPGLPDAERGINYVNGLHERGRYLMPAWGGLFSPLDAAAQETIREAFPDLEVVPIFCAETQRRGGGVHCAASAW